MTGVDTSDPLREALDVVLFSAGGRRIGVEARHVRGLTRLPGAGSKPRIEDVLGLPPGDAPSAPSRLQFKRTDLEFLVDGPVEFVRLPAVSIRPLPSLLAACTRLSGLRALAFMDVAGKSTLVLLFDIEGVRSHVLKDSPLGAAFRR